MVHLNGISLFIYSIRIHTHTSAARKHIKQKKNAY